MDILRELAEGKRGAVARSSAVAAYVLEHPAELSNLIAALSLRDAIVVSHAAHAMLTVFKRAPDLFQEHRDALLAILQKQDQWEVIEQLSKILPHLGLGAADRHKLLVRLQTLFEEHRSSIARTCALQAIVDMADLDDAFDDAATAALKLALETGSKAMQARARNLMAGR